MENTLTPSKEAEVMRMLQEVFPESNPKSTPEGIKLKVSALENREFFHLTEIISGLDVNASAKRSGDAISILIS